MKTWNNEHTFNYPWETIIQATWRKYPNPFNPSVHGIDVLDRKVENGVLKSHRLITTKWGIPDWSKPILGNIEVSYGSEHTDVDPSSKTMTMKTRNITWGNLITIDERLVYQQHPTVKNATQMKQETRVTVAKDVPFSSYLESIVTEVISKNAAKGREGMDHVISKIVKETAQQPQPQTNIMEALNLLNLTNPRAI